MTPSADLDQVFIGWDVGGWNCDKNPTSRDALVVLNATGEKLGQPWRGNLRQTINATTTAADFLTAILGLCKLAPPADTTKATIAIDAPLGFPAAFAQLLTGGAPLDQIGSSHENPYLFRLAERRLAEEGLTSLSTVKDMIGSQSTKAMHTVARFAKMIAPGVWSDGAQLTLIETYPALCRTRVRGVFPKLAKPINGPAADIMDAEVCADIAQGFVLWRDWLEPPPTTAPLSEGWIWAPLEYDEPAKVSQ